MLLFSEEMNELIAIYLEKEANEWSEGVRQLPRIVAKIRIDIILPCVVFLEKLFDEFQCFESAKDWHVNVEKKKRNWLNLLIAGLDLSIFDAF